MQFNCSFCSRNWEQQSLNLHPCRKVDWAHVFVFGTVQHFNTTTELHTNSRTTFGSTEMFLRGFLYQSPQTRSHSADNMATVTVHVLHPRWFVNSLWSAVCHPESSDHVTASFLSESVSATWFVPSACLIRCTASSFPPTKHHLVSNSLDEAAQQEYFNTVVGISEEKIHQRSLSAFQGDLQLCLSRGKCSSWFMSSRWESCHRLSLHRNLSQSFMELL